VSDKALYRLLWCVFCLAVGMWAHVVYLDAVRWPW
jgi:hypothetical protein